jgi:hypothetical protein
MQQRVYVAWPAKAQHGSGGSLFPMILLVLDNLYRGVATPDVGMMDEVYDYEQSLCSILGHVFDWFL